ncbi:hypothetical protein [Ferrimicrobium acidiphilum]|uniref:hypothetical protein n=1 Tax=Ferrimicrobium acidiphilum TaxID=121039 RepID=UPI0023F1D3C4|nr:hypothetical protein [Ferrimicrobium acidiphilum]
MSEDITTEELEWGEPVRRTGSKRKLAAVVSVRFTPEELARLRKSLPDGNLSQFVRQAALQAIDGPKMVSGPVDSYDTDFEVPLTIWDNFAYLSASVTGTIFFQAVEMSNLETVR